MNEIEAMFFKPYPSVVGINKDVEGYKIENRKYILGLRAGPDSGISNLVHEMGHLAEREINKLVERSPYAWGYYMGKPWQVLNQSGVEPQNDKSVFREARVWAYQLSVLRHFGLMDETVEEMVSPAVYLSAWWLYAKRVTGASYSKEKEAVRILAKYVAKLASTKFTFENFCINWKIRMKALASSL